MKTFRIIDTVRVVTDVEYTEATYPGMDLDKARAAEMDADDETRWETVMMAMQMREPGDGIEQTRTVDLIDTDNGDVASRPIPDLPRTPTDGPTFLTRPEAGHREPGMKFNMVEKDTTDDQLDKIADAVKEGLAADANEAFVFQPEQHGI